MKVSTQAVNSAVSGIRARVKRKLDQPLQVKPAKVKKSEDPAVMNLISKYIDEHGYYNLKCNILK